jgi:molybdopterin-guanine dinucleotide biosynthesis protein A
MVPTTLAILAGGRGSRMGATKDRLTVAGQPILLHLLGRLAHVGPTLLVTSPEHPEPVGHERFDRIAFDHTVGVGPLAGIIAALEGAGTETVCVLSVDMPNVGAEHVAWLREALADRPAAVGLMCRRTDGVGGQIEPFPGIFRAAAAGAVSAHLAAGGRSVHSLLDLPGFEAVTVPAEWPDDVWLNLNRPDDLGKIGATIL